jgi:hypothetical protein
MEGSVGFVWKQRRQSVRLAGRVYRLLIKVQTARSECKGKCSEFIRKAGESSRERGGRSERCVMNVLEKRTVLVLERDGNMCVQVGVVGCARRRAAVVTD